MAVFVLMTSLVIITGVLYQYFGNIQQSQLEDELHMVAGAMEQLGEDYLESLDFSNYRLSWIAEDGTVLYDSHKEVDDMENHADREEIKEAFAYGFGSSKRYSTTLTKQNIYEAIRLSDGSILRLSQSRATVVILMLGMLHPVVFILILAAVCSVYLAKWMAKRVVEPLNKLDLEKPLENDTYEELSPLLYRIYAQQQKIKRQVQSEEQHRREFTANVSHELKTPLQSIIGSAELLENGIVKQEDIPRFVGHIHKEASRLVCLIDDIIRLSQLDEKVEMPKEEVSLRALSEEVYETLFEVAKRRHISIEITGDDGMIKGVRRLLYEIVYNLCDNAVKYNYAGGNVNISIEDKMEEVCLKVQDTGIGIAKEYQDKIFERFYRVDKSHSKQSGGTGLGLSIVKHAVQYHHGNIVIESELKKGTMILISFPKS